MVHLYMVYLLKMVIFHSYVSLPEGIYIYTHLIILRIMVSGTDFPTNPMVIPF